MEVTKVLVPVNGERVDEEVIKLACTIARRRKGKVYVVYVIQVKRALPLDAEIESETQKGEKILKRAERIAGELDYQVETELLQAREVGPALVDEAVERGVDLILMGINYKKRFGEFNLGSTVPYVLKNAPCRVLLWREPIE
ncbi:MAG: universal stress protein [Dehalococcoidia bacterium]|nr:MAG: universal stress protein [Dehalococcoidia bacterium]